MNMFDKVEAEIKTDTGDQVHVVHLARQPLVACGFSELRAYQASGVFYAKLYKNNVKVSGWNKGPDPEVKK